MPDTYNDFNIFHPSPHINILIFVFALFLIKIYKIIIFNSVTYVDDPTTNKDKKE